MNLGYVGLGNMGGALARRLQRGHTLAVYDRSDTAVKRLVDEGASACSSPAEVASRSELILLCLPTSEHVRTVLFDDDGIAAAAKPGTVIVDQSTGDPAVTREMAATLAGRGLELVDAPVAGGVMGAEAGTIGIMVGATPAQFAVVNPVLRTISPNVLHAGDVGSGHVMKLVNNMLAGANRALGLEAMALAAKNGVDPGRAVDIILAGSGGNFFLENFARSHIIPGKLASGFTLGLYQKDIRLACRMGDASGVPLFFGNLVKDYFQICTNELGPDAGVNGVALVVDRLAGTHVVPEDHDL